jgi:PAS domain S-box-containing protein
LVRHPRPTIGLLIDWVEGGYHSALWSGVADVSREQDVNLLCFVGGPLHSPIGLEIQRNALYDLVDTPIVDGLVIAMGTLGNFSDLEQCKSFCERYRPLPMVSIALTLEGIPSIVVDNRPGMHEAVAHLIEVHGHRHIAFIRGPEGAQDANQRYRAYTDTLAKHGLPFDPDLVAPGDFIRSTGSAAIHLLLDERKVSFDAIVAANDGMALGALESLQARGIMVPDDVAVVGFDDTEQARFSPLPLTTVRQPIYRLGRQAVEMLLAQLRGEDVPERVTLPSELVVRASCGCSDQTTIRALDGPEIHSLARYRLQAQEQSIALRTFSEVLSTTFDMAEMMNAVAQELPHLGIECCYLSLYEPSVGSKTPSEWSRLVLAYDKTGRIELDPRSRRFPSHQLAPDGILRREKRYSLLGEALFFREEQIGFVLFDAHPRGETVYEMLRVQISSALKGALLFQKHEQRVTELAVLNELGQALTARLNVGEVLSEAYRQASRLLDAASFYIALYDLDKDEVTFAIDVTDGNIQKFFSVRQAAKGLTEYIIHHQTPLLIREDLPKRLQELGIEPVGRMALSWLGVPLMIGRQVLGVMAVQSYTTARAYDERDMDTLTAIASQTAIAIHNAQLYEQAQHEIAERGRAEEEARRRAAQAALIYQVGQRVSGELELEALLSEIVTAVRDAFDYHSVLLMLLNEEANRLTLQAIAGGYADVFPADLWLDVGEGMIGHAAATGAPQISGDVSQNPHYIRKATEITQSELAVPIKSGRDTIGVLDLQSNDPDAFDSTDVMLMETLADQIAAAIKNARLYEKAQQQLREQTALFEASQRLASAPLRAEEVAEIAVRELAEIMEAECSFSLLDPQGDTLQVLADFWVEEGIERWEREAESFRLSDYSATARVMETLKPLVVQASAPDADPAELAYMQEYETATLVILPLAVKGQAIGVMELETREERHHTPEQLNMAMTLANQVAVALENARLYEAMQQELGERRRAEEALAHERDLLHALMDNTPDAIYFKDADSRFVKVNKAQAQVLVGNHDFDEIIGKTDFDFFAADHAQDAYQDEQKIVRSGQPLSDKLEKIQRADGQTRWVSTTKIPLIGKDGQIAGTIGITRDITERKRAEEQLQLYAAEMERINEEVKRFAYIVSHDLRAPLVNMKGFASELRLALDEIQSVVETILPHLDEEQKQKITRALQEDVPEALEFIDSSVTYMDRFIHALLKLSRLGRYELKLEPVDVNVIVQTTLQTMAHQIAEHQGKVIVDTLPEVIADQTSMEQIIGNILDNAVKYLTSDRPAEIRITAERGDDETIFHFHDNGCGIAPDDMDKVFTPFQRAGRQDVPGEGMGLAYVQALVRRHGGRIWCKSEPGVGTTFSFTISNNLQDEQHI